jgi:1-acyl-sn-glycerol-3-phosphate acyltransferase
MAAMRRSFHWWRTVFYLIPAVSLYTIVLGSLSLLSTLVDRRGNLGHKCARAWSWLILKTTGVSVEIEGLERLDRSRSYVFAANHQSIYDIPILFANIPFQLRILAKDSLGRIPFLGWHLSRTGHVLVDRSKAGTGVVRKMKRLVDEGHSLIVFPEGTRSTDGSVARFKGGSFVIALQSGLPVVPITVIGSRHVMFRGDLTVRPGRVRVIVHPPIETAAVPKESVREFAASVRDVIAHSAA